jgi:hypothetical protein
VGGFGFLHTSRSLGALYRSILVAFARHWDGVYSLEYSREESNWRSELQERGNVSRRHSPSAQLPGRGPIPPQVGQHARVQLSVGEECLLLVVRLFPDAGFANLQRGHGSGTRCTLVHGFGCAPRGKTIRRRGRHGDRGVGRALLIGSRLRSTACRG